MSATQLQRSSTVLRRSARPVAAIAVLAPLYLLARLPDLPGAERARLAARFQFVRSELPEVSSKPQRDTRPVHPSLAHISAWINSLGGAAALADLDGDGLPNDIAWVDTRTDQVFVAPVPGTPERFAAFELDPAPLAYDPETMAPMGALPCDANEDGRADVLVYFWGRTPILFLCREPAQESDASIALERRAYHACELVPGAQRWYTNAACGADLDGDGHVDFVFGNYFKDGARILDAHGTGHEEMQASMTRACNGGLDHLLIWKTARSGREPEATFEEAGEALSESQSCSWTLAVGAADLDGDLLPELYFANDFGPDVLLHNRSRPGAVAFAPLYGEKTLTMPSSKVLGRDSFKGMGVDFGDLNGDGLLDIYVSNITTEYGLEESQFAFLSTGATARMHEGVAPYVDASEGLGLSRSGWAWEARLGDFDNDGTLEALQALGFLKGSTNRWPELHEDAMGNDQLLADPRVWHRFLPGDDLNGDQPNCFFVRDENGRYWDVARAVGLGMPQLSRAIASADFDGDGRLDLAIGNQWEASAVYWNAAPDAGAFLGLHVLLATEDEAVAPTRVVAGHPRAGLRGRPAIGAEVRVELDDGRKLCAQVDGGNGHSGKRSPDVHFGLGTSTALGHVRSTVRWRDARGKVCEQTFALNPGWHTLLLGSPAQEDERGLR